LKQVTSVFSLDSMTNIWRHPPPHRGSQSGENKIDDDSLNDDEYDIIEHHEIKKEGDADSDALDIDQSDAKEVEPKDLFSSLEEAGVKIQHLSPPIPVSIALVALKMTPTCLILWFSLVNFLFSLVSGSFKPGLLLFPMILIPFATKFLGIGKRGWTAGTILSSISNDYTDGMSLLLHDSPRALDIWQKIAYINDTVKGVSKEELVDALVESPKHYFNPSEETIANAPDFSGWIAAKLVISLIIDFLGVLSVGVPVIGEVLDVAWAPVSGYIIHSLYGVTMLSWLGIIEELLPFTDIVPTATIAWVYTYGEHFPAWTVRMSRNLAASLPQMKII